MTNMYTNPNGYPKFKTILKPRIYTKGQNYGAKVHSLSLFTASIYDYVGADPYYQNLDEKGFVKVTVALNDFGEIEKKKAVQSRQLECILPKSFLGSDWNPSTHG